MFSAIPFALQNTAHSAELFRQAVSSFVPPGGGIVTTGDFAVTQTGTPSMNVSVGVGRIWLPGTNVGNVVGGNFSSQAMYYGQNPAAQTVSIATSDPVNPRIDVVYAAVQDSQYAGTSNAGIISVVTGVPSPTPATPAIPANALALKKVNVPANASSIVNANLSAPTPTLKAINPSFRLGTAYTPIWTGVTDFGTGGSLTGTYWVEGDRVRVRSKAMFGSGAVLGNSVVKCPLPPGFPIAGTETFHLGTGTYTPASGIGIQPLLVFQNSAAASVWIASSPVKTPGDVPVSVASGSFFEIDFSYQTSSS